VRESNVVQRPYHQSAAVAGKTTSSWRALVNGKADAVGRREMKTRQAETVQRGLSEPPNGQGVQLQAPPPSLQRSARPRTRRLAGPEVHDDVGGPAHRQPCRTAPAGPVSCNSKLGSVWMQTTWETDARSGERTRRRVGPLREGHSDRYAAGRGLMIRQGMSRFRSFEVGPLSRESEIPLECILEQALRESR
jgi:hypothetical protein